MENNPYASGPISLGRNQQLFNYILFVSITLQTASSKQELIAKGSKVYARNKDDDEIFELNSNYSDIIGKYIIDFRRSRSAITLDLTEEESNTLRTAIHAANYLIKEHDLKTPEDYDEMYGLFKS